MATQWNDESITPARGTCVRCAGAGSGGICDACLDDLAGWLQAATRTWRNYAPQDRLGVVRTVAADLHSAVWTPPPAVPAARLPFDDVEATQ